VADAAEQAGRAGPRGVPRVTVRARRVMSQRSASTNQFSFVVKSNVNHTRVEDLKLNFDQRRTQRPLRLDSHPHQFYIVHTHSLRRRGG
jgi:hypothetical protein